MTIKKNLDGRRAFNLTQQLKTKNLRRQTGAGELKWQTIDAVLELESQILIVLSFSG
jgi:hypothetical protein